jgi:hypothetical protein
MAQGAVVWNGGPTWPETPPEDDDPRDLQIQKVRTLLDESKYAQQQADMEAMKRKLALTGGN